MEEKIIMKNNRNMPTMTAAVTLLLLAAFSTITASEQQIYGDIFQESRSLLLHSSRALLSGFKCQREVPAMFFQTHKQEPVRGNGSSIHFHRLEVCCQGYSRSPFDWEKCVPDCSTVSPNNCGNGFCRAPNQCICYDEFVQNDRGECIHTCPIACQYGRCYLNGTCECHVGYTLDPSTRKFCRPDCPQACGNNQECIAPGKCACKEGYRKTAHYGCQPICTPDCGYGKCVGPNQCECFLGYKKRMQRNVCEAECYIKCENGFCESRYKCQCRIGYKYDANTTSCLPDCGEECQDGVCVAPGECRCFEGYQLQDNICVPICLGGCGDYGKCIEPNVCGCGIANQHCLQGSCDANGRCLCEAGKTHFVDKCVDATELSNMVVTYDQRDYYNEHLKDEFQGLIGRLFNMR